MEQEVQSISKQAEFPIPQSPRNALLHKKSIVLVAIFVLFVIIAFLGGTYYQAMNQKKLAVSVSPAQVVRSISPTTAPNENWKSYSNSEYGYSLQYPSTWTLNTESPTTTSFIMNEPKKKFYKETQTFQYVTPPNPKTFAIISISDAGGKEKSPEEIAKVYRSGETKAIVVGGRSAVEVITTEQKEGEQLVEGGQEIAVFVKDNDGENLFIQLTTANMTAYQPVFDQILNTFTFSGTNTSLDNIWKTYTNIENGYSIKYPRDKLVRINCLDEELNLVEKNAGNAVQDSVAIPTCGRDGHFLMEFRTIHVQDSSLKPDTEHYEITTEPVKINSFSGLKYTYKQIKQFDGQGGPAWYQLIDIPNSGGAYEFYLEKEDYIPLRDQILSTFTLLK